jgi:hypothetical protein
VSLCLLAPVLSSARWEGACCVQEAVREFDCRRCGRRTCVCRRCDRGQAYCGEDCAELSRQVYSRAARARYQNTRRGAHLHADRQRQRQYRARGGPWRRTKAKIVTDLGSVAARDVGTVVAHAMSAHSERTDEVSALRGTCKLPGESSLAALTGTDQRYRGTGS